MLRRPDLGQMLDQISQMLATTRAKLSKLPLTELPPDTLERVNELETMVSQYVDLSERLCISLGYQKGDLESILKDPSRFKESDQRTIARATQLQAEANKTYHNLSLLMQAVKKIGNMRSLDPKKRSAERAKKFGRVGGRKGWTPM